MPRAGCVDRLLAHRVKEPVFRSSPWTVKAASGSPAWAPHRDSVARSGALLQPRPWSCCVISTGDSRGSGLEQLQEGSGDRPDVPGCWLRAAPLPHLWLHWSLGAGWGSRQGDSLVGHLQALGQGHQRVQEKGVVWAESEHDGEAKMPLSTATGAASSLGLLVIPAFGRKLMEKSLRNVVF